MADNTSQIAGLFMTPEMYQQQQSDLALQRGVDLAKLDPLQAAKAQQYQAGYKLGGAIGGALGGQDPMLQLQSLRASVLKGVDQTDAKSLAAAAKALADAGDLQGANAIAQQSVGIQAKIDERQAAREQALQIARERIAAQIQMAEQRGADQKQIAQMRIEGQQQIAQLAAALKGGGQGKTLAPSLQKDESKDLATVDSYENQITALNPAIASLKPNEKGVRTLELGPLKNLKYESQLAAGNSTPEARAYESLKSAVDTAVNLQVSAEKGVQTDKDVLRFAKALIASYGRNDSAATLQALERFQSAMKNAQDQTKARIESRRKSQGVEAYYGETTNSSDPLGLRK